MKLRNKKTGEIAEASILNFELVVRYGDGRVEKYPLLFDYSNFEYYKEPKKYWFIDAYGNIVQNEITKHRGNTYTDMSSDYETQKQIGNYFETEEEAEKAVEKLKAWKRLQDYYINFRLDFVKNTINFTYRIDGTLHSAINEERIIFEDMKTIFGGNDESSN